MEIYKNYKGHEVRATIERDGSITCFGKTFNSLSYAAIEVVERISNIPNPQTNGWNFWQYMDPETDKLRPMDALRH